MGKYAKQLADNLKRLVPEMYGSQTEFARAAGLTQSQASQYMRSEAVPKLDNLEGMAAALRVSIADLIGDTIPDMPIPPTATLDRDKLEAISFILRADEGQVRNILTILKPPAGKNAKLSSG